MEVPKSLYEGLAKDEHTQRATRLGRFLVLEELGYFGEESNIKLAQGDYEGTFTAAIRRKFSNTYGNTDGCHPADIEVAAELLDVFDQIYNAEAIDGAAA